MATVINNPTPVTADSSSGNGMGFFLGIILLIVFVAILLMYGLPYLANSMRGPQVNVPSKVDINLHSTGK